jgi:sodium/bile acid cotransporter 7
MTVSSPPRFALLRRLTPDFFTSALMLAMVAATFWPAAGESARVLGHVTTVAIGALFSCCLPPRRWAC